MHTIALWVLALVPFFGYSSAACRGGTIVANKLSSNQKNNIVAVHNYYRNLVAQGKAPGQPSAQNMIEMVWDDELARMAQEWSDNCIFEHNPREDRKTSDGTVAGQNLAIQMTSEEYCNPNTIKSLVDSWYNEVKSYKFSNRQILSETGHYTQVVWANTRKVGCGYTVFKDESWTNCFLACNYSPPGNYVGQYPYKAGQKNCRAYKLTDSIKYTHLCAM